MRKLVNCYRNAGMFVVVAACLAAGPAGRTTKQILVDMQAAQASIAKVNQPDCVKYNAIYAQQMARDYGPLYEKLDSLYAEYGEAVPKLAVTERHLIAIDDARLAFWGVEGAQTRVDRAASDADLVTATDGKLGEALIAWWKGRGDVRAQAKVADDIELMAKASPASVAVSDALHLMLITCPVSVPLGQRLTIVLCKTMGKTALGREYAAQARRLEMPLVAEGTQINGRSFKSTSWAGKVVLVDFWATWCPPCMEEIPHVAKVYKRYHDQGLEIVGVSSDSDRKELAAFLNQHPEMPWPELFHAGTQFHPLTKKFDINGIPTMYILDRSGNLRTIDGRDEMDEVIPRLLAEPYTPPAKPPSGKPLATGRPLPSAG